MSLDAKWYAGWIRLLPASSAAEKQRNLEAADLMEELDKRIPHWISVEERLPEPKEDVALYIRCGDVSFIRTGWRMGNGQFLCPNDSISGYEVTHWMPLPSTEGIK